MYADYYVFISPKILRVTLLSLRFIIEIPTFAFFKILSPTLSLYFRWSALESL